eukprot:TRINITY_DN13500_c0_g1_i1.p1 TRINITY_DN13500_c0_g1~~TRINITY_DN13500_c0_g1_i1.p1  ORF type:complete len:414 (+),score=53.44 TRINITY_DN13500_c0_g1_i1:45-1286(+)
MLARPIVLLSLGLEQWMRAGALMMDHVGGKGQVHSSLIDAAVLHSSHGDFRAGHNLSAAFVPKSHTGKLAAGIGGSVSPAWLLVAAAMLAFIVLLLVSITKDAARFKRETHGVSRSIQVSEKACKSRRPKREKSWFEIASAYLAVEVPRWVPCTAAIHLVVVELRPMYAFYVAARNLTITFAVKAEQLRSGATFADPTSCLRRAVSQAIWTGRATGGDAICYSEQGLFVATLHWSTIFVVVLFVCVAFGLMLRSGCRHFADSDYLIFTWQLEHASTYRKVAHFLFAYTVLGVLLMFATVGGFLTGNAVRFSYSELHDSLCPDLALLLYSMYAMAVTHDPEFDWNTPEFAALQWHRSFKDLFTQSNDAFAVQLASALNKADQGQADDLEVISGDAVEGQKKMLRLRTNPAFKPL